MGINVDNKLILNNIKNHLGFKKQSEFANFLGIAPTTLSSWYARNTFDMNLVYSKCSFLNTNWLLTGEGEMLKEKTTTSENLENENLKDRCKSLEESVRLLKQENELLKKIIDLTDRIYFLENSKHKSKKDQNKED